MQNMFKIKWKLYYKLVSWIRYHLMLSAKPDIVKSHLPLPCLFCFIFCLWVSDYDCWEKVCSCKRKFKMDSSCYYILFLISVYLMSINVLAHNTFEFIAKWINRKHIILLDSLLSMVISLKVIQCPRSVQT